MCRTYLRDRHGFTLVELMISLAIIGILVATTAPLANTYRLKAEYLDLKTTARYLMDGMESYYIENSEFYPPSPPGSTFWMPNPPPKVSKGEEKYISELKYTFHQGHKNSYTFNRFKWKQDSWFFGNKNIDYAWIVIDTDFDYNRDGKNDTYTIHMQMENNKPKEGFYREFIPNPF
jgi:prepilin-type N-terminal cleavage/methylation domain-containing protein